MIDEDRYITLAIHTYEKALAIKTLLENEGIEVVLNNVNLAEPVVSAGVRVRIHERDLPQALRIVENVELFMPADGDVTVRSKIIVPIDFSDYSRQALVLAFNIAARHKADVVFLHSFVTPTPAANLQLSANYTYEIADVGVADSLQSEAADQMAKFVDSVREKIKTGEVPPVKFETRITEGVPEDCIDDLAKAIKPLMIVMGTRGAGKKERELIGSVTAEVLDTCRCTICTVPESSQLTEPGQLRHVLFFSNLDQEDLLAIDTFHRTFGRHDITVTIVHVPGRRESAGSVKRSARSLKLFCKAHYPEYTFEARDLNLDDIAASFREIAAECPIDMIVLPNKKRNVFVRLFNPGLAHRLLFHADIPLLAIPV